MRSFEVKGYSYPINFSSLPIVKRAFSNLLLYNAKSRKVDKYFHFQVPPLLGECILPQDFSKSFIARHNCSACSKPYKEYELTSYDLVCNNQLHHSIF